MSKKGNLYKIDYPLFSFQLSSFAATLIKDSRQKIKTVLIQIQVIRMLIGVRVVPLL